MTQSLAQLQAEWLKRAERLSNIGDSINSTPESYAANKAHAERYFYFASALQPHVEREAKYEAVVKAAMKWRDATNDAEDLVAANELLDTLAALSSEESKPLSSSEAVKAAQAKSLADERRIAELEALLAELRNPLKAIRDAITNEALRKAQDDFMPIYGRVFYRIPEAALRVGDAT